MFLIVENVGAGPAYDLRLSCEPDFQMEHGQKLSEMGVFAHGLRYLAPRQKVGFFLTNIVGQLDEIQKRGGRFDFEVVWTASTPWDVSRSSGYSSGLDDWGCGERLPNVRCS